MKKSTDSNNPQWLDTLRDDVNHYDATPPAFEWDKIAASLDATPSKGFLQQRKSLFIGGISAVAAILILGFVLLGVLDDGFQKTQNLFPTATVPLASVSPSLPIYSILPTDSIEDGINKDIVRKKLLSQGQSTHLINSTIAISAVTVAGETSIVTKEDNSEKNSSYQSNDDEQKEEDQALLNKRKRQREYLQKLKEENEFLEEENKKLERNLSRSKKGRIAVGLIADAGLMNQSKTANSTVNHDIYIPHSKMNYASVMNDAEGVKLYRLNDFSFLAQPSYSYNHKRPWSLGLSISKNYTPRLTLVSGINYTKLSAEVTDEVDQRIFDQTVHYLSIPVAIQWALIQQQHYNVYLSLGTMIGRSLSAHIDNKSVSLHGVQVSLNTSLGAQYFLLPHWSIFGEVGYAKFYDDDKRIETYRDTHSTDVTFSFGCRWHF